MYRDYTTYGDHKTSILFIQSSRFFYVADRTTKTPPRNVEQGREEEKQKKNAKTRDRRSTENGKKDDELIVSPREIMKLPRVKSLLLL